MICKTYFSATITDGHSFKNLIGMLKNETDQISFLISKQSITSTFVNKGQYGIHDIYINTEELSDYSYDILDHDQYSLTVNAAELHNTIKSIGRKDSLK